ncbi:MAG: hypothetical protein LJE61_00335 [Thiocapsa sp.]|jgi:hypothetical protein|nr:hypothetical protein [Thiocapsa sp.]MCG6983637.1 hypothetical protein [Thiocapsa sp.]
MDQNPLKAIEFFGFMALAGWLVYSQLVASRRDHARQHGSGSEAGEDASRDETDTPA